MKLVLLFFTNKKYIQFEKKWSVASEAIKAFYIDDDENLSLTVQTAITLGWSDPRKQSTLHVYLLLLLRQALGDNFSYRYLLYQKFGDTSDTVLVSSNIQLACI